MTHKTAYLWGSVSSFSGPLAAWLLQKGWHVHIATKPPLNVFALTPLDLPSSAQISLEKALGGHNELRTFQDRLKFLETSLPDKGTIYDAAIFCGLPPNFDEPRAPRAPWAAGELGPIAKHLKGVPFFLVSSLWAGVQSDGVVPEEIEFQRRKPVSHWEGVCQQYEQKLLKSLPHLESPWHLIRLPIISGHSTSGKSQNFSGLFTLLHLCAKHKDTQDFIPTKEHRDELQLSYNPDSTLWFLPIDFAVYLFWRLLEDIHRPRICNLVSTQATLNREWLEYLARALGYSTVARADKDTYPLPGILRKMLKDNMLVKTRSLFEVSGRYQQTAAKLDEAYFQEMLLFGKSNNWGNPVVQEHAGQKLIFSTQLARTYFEEFLPYFLGKDKLTTVTAHDTTLGFCIEDSERLAWILRSDNGKALVESFNPVNKKPHLLFRLTGSTMVRLISNQLSLHKALLLQQVHLEGSLLDAWRVSNAMDAFFKEHPYKPTDTKDCCAAHAAY
ncbi:MAG: hypothetical protein HY711_04530 [Candidatus Melainabacteria bacterium]|nr:hypothetical protein [Candidatus Melainabacteria bacterium]